jgi:arabinofuranan 3-O-arabinosyltransferase
LTVHLAAPSLASSLDAYTVEPSLLGLGVSELRIEGLTPAITVDRASLGTPIAFPCGEGPDLRVDGRRMSTSVTTTVGDVLRSVPVAAEPCSGDDDAVEVTMAAGDVRVRAGSPDRWDVASVVITRDGAATLDGSSLSQPLIRSWQETHRAVALAARSGSSVLVVNENANRGWRATMAGRALDSVTIDGWQQGFVVPAGSAGVVRLDFTPDGPVRAGMAAGGLLAIGIVLLALIPERRRAREVLPPGRLGRVAVVAVSVACVGLVAGWWGFAVVAGVGVLGVAGRHWLPDAVFARTCVAGTVLCSLGAGMVLLAGPYGSTTYAADHPAAQLLCVAAVAMLILSLWRPEGVQRVARRERTEVEPGVPAGSAVVRGNGS